MQTFYFISSALACPIILRHAYTSVQNNARYKTVPNVTMNLKTFFLERWKIFNWLREKKATRFMLQEVNRTEKRNHLWKAEWGFEMPFFPLMKTIKRGFVFFSFINSLVADQRFCFIKPIKN